MPFECRSYAPATITNDLLKFAELIPIQSVINLNFSNSVHTCKRNIKTIVTKDDVTFQTLLKKTRKLIAISPTIGINKNAHSFNVLS